MSRYGLLQVSVNAIDADRDEQVDDDDRLGAPRRRDRSGSVGRVRKIVLASSTAPAM